MRCLDDHKGDCEGAVELRTPLSATGTPFPRCDRHWDQRLDEQDRINRLYPSSQPDDFDPLYAGERWDEDDEVAFDPARQFGEVDEAFDR